jgi:hypothetical protein
MIYREVKNDFWVPNDIYGKNTNNKFMFFFVKHSTNVDAHIYAHTLTPMNAHTHTISL